MFFELLSYITLSEMMEFR